MRKYYLLLFGTLYSLLSFAQINTDIGSPINEPSFMEKSPSISLDGKYLCFVSNKSGSWGLYISESNAGSGWSKPEAIAEVNSFSNKQGLIIDDPCFNYNANIIYFSANYEGSKGGLDIYYIKRTLNGWSQPKQIPGDVNSADDEASPSITADNSTLYFTRNSFYNDKEDYSCKRILFSRVKKTGEWSKPNVVPKTVNDGCVSTPFICPDNRTLFFAAVNDEDFGWDLYYTKHLAKNVWLKPARIDTIATEYDELKPSTTADGDILYFTREGRERRMDFKGVNKIPLQKDFKPGDILTIKGEISDLFTKEPLVAYIEVYNSKTSELINRAESNRDGSYQIVLPKGPAYNFIVYFEGSSYHFFNYEPNSAISIVKEDIRLFSKTSLILNVYDEELFDPLNVSFQVCDAINREILPVAIEETTLGRYALTLPIGMNYQIITSRQNYVADTLLFNLDKIVQFDEFERDIELEALKRDFEINVSDLDTDQGLEVEIVVTNLENNEQIVTTATVNEDGKYVIQLREGDKYEINVKSPKGYAFYNTTVDMDSEQKNKKLDVKLTPLKAATKITLNNITFETNSADLNSSSFEELDRVVNLMGDNPELKIEISAHTDDVGSDKYNLKLSDRRAQSVVDYLIENEIPITRLIAKGYGETQPLVNNDSDENRAKNRRVELKIIDVEESTEQNN